MAEIIVRDWISEYKSLRSAEIHSFGCTIVQNNELIQAVFSVLEEKRYHEEFLEPMCHQFFSFYRSREESLQSFTRQYIPSLVGLYLSSTAKGNKKNVRCVEVVLLGIYNLEVMDPCGKASCLSFRIPLLSKPSIYHEPMSLSHTILSERAVSSLEYADTRTITLGPYPEVEKISASNRLLVMTVLMRLYNQNVGNMSTFSLMSVCRMCSRVVKHGFNRSNRTNYGNDGASGYSSPHPRPTARIPLSASLLLEMIHAVYFSTFNGFASVGLQSLDELHNRAAHEMLSDVLLVTNAIRHSLKVNQTGQPSDGPMGISIALSPTTVASSISRAITNASFRSKKLPDDIPIQDGDGGESTQLSAINEESEEAEIQQSSHRGSRKHASGNGITKSGVLQLRKSKDRKKEGEDRRKEPDLVENGRANGSSNNTEDHDVHPANGEVSLRGSYSCRTDVTSPKSPPGAGLNNEETIVFKGTTKYGGAEVVVTNDGNCVLKSVVHRSESSNGMQNSVQTAV